MIDFFKSNMDYFKKFILAVAVVVVFKTFDNLTSIFHGLGVVIDAIAPFFAALIIAYMLNLPVVKLSGLIKKIKYKRISEHSYGISVFIIYVLAILLLVVTISALVPALYQNLLDMTVTLPKYITKVLDKFKNIEFVQNLNLSGDFLSANTAVKSLLDMFDAKELSGYVGQVFSMTSGVFKGFIAFIGSVYMLLDKRRIIAGMERLVNILFKEKKAEGILLHASRINSIFTKYIYCRLICSVICGVVCGITLSLLRVQYALILAIIIGAMDMIPYFGSIISYVVAILITLLTGTMWQTIWVAVALLIIQQLDGNLLAPRLMGNSLELRPLWIVVAVSVGGTLFGFIGMLLSVPVLAVLRTIASDYINELQASRMASETKDNMEDVK